MIRLAWASLLIFAACTTSSHHETNATLASLPNMSASLLVWAAEDGKPTTGFVTIAYDTEAFRAAHGGHCAELGDLDVNIDHVTITEISPGGDTDEADCGLPTIDFEIPDFAGAPPTGFSITDDAATVAATFAGLAPHYPTLVSPSTWTFGAGDPVVLRWSHPEDLASALPENVYFHTGTITDPNFFPLDTTYTTDEIHFAIPSPAPITGAGLIVARFGYVNITPTSCTGATTCRIQVERGYAHSVTIED